MIESEENYIPEEEIPPVKQFDLDKFMGTRGFKTGVGILFGILILLLGISAFNYFSRLNPPDGGKPTPTPTAPLVIVPTNPPSKWATDSGILNARDSFTAISNDLKKLNLQENDLTFPALDFKINFEKAQ